MTTTRRKKKKVPTRQGDRCCGVLEAQVKEVMEKYFRDMDGHQPADVYELILTQIEIPLFESVLAHTGGNVTHAAEILGLNRATFRNRLRKHGMQ